MIVGRRQPLYVVLMGVVLAAAVLLRIFDPTPVARMRLAIFDSLLMSAPRPIDETFPVRILDIDEASLAEFGQWPWPRTRLADIITRLNEAGARTITVDLILAEPDRWNASNIAKELARVPGLEPLGEKASTLPSNDDVLAAAITKAPVVLGFAGERDVSRQLVEPRAPFAIAGDDPMLFVPSFAGGVGSLPVLSEAATGIGAVNWIPESDQVVRRVPLLITAGGKLYPSLSLETIRIAQGAGTTILVRSSGASGILSFGEQTGIDSIRAGEVILPTDAQGELWLKFAPPDPRRSISARDLLAGRVDKSEIEGRFIFIGTSATGLMDLRTTPLVPALAGVEIHAQALEQMLTGDHLVRPSWATGAELVFLAVAGLLSASLIARSQTVARYIATSGAVAAAILTVAAIAGVVALSWFAYRDGLLIDPVYPSLALLAVYLVGSLTNYVRSEADRARIRSAFGYYVSPTVVEELARTPDRLKLGGDLRDVTLLFADVRGFSRLSEGMTAEELVRFINKLFTPLADEILAHRGTIDKFMGDAVMAFWNAPLTDPDHARQACRAALAMQASIVAMNAKRGENTEPIRIGIGLNTGACVVGNVGSPQRFDYSVLGDVVNTASRIEETTKTYGTPIIIGEQTAADAADFAIVEITTTALRGKDRGEKLFALVGDETAARHPRWEDLKRHVLEFAQAMATNDVPAARRHIVAARSLGVLDAAPLLEAAEQRLPL
ncbi:MAG TPA: adenylate/guanylate cyclase domain-containing protein [Hyphomicrobium sp.]|nr:adenylate/guanylate cyclase domain-containing protein [Hyphomicrobium sp.]